ncbi:MAG: response regulator transcription factor [Lautropia sp.]
MAPAPATDGLLALYRSARLMPSAAFLDVVSQLLAGLTAASTARGSGRTASADLISHLFEALCVNARISGGGVDAQAFGGQPASFALSGLDGSIQLEAPGFSALMAVEWPRMSTGRLPDEIIGLAGHEGARQYSGRRIGLQVQSAGSALLVGARRLGTLDGLPARRRTIARLYAEGWPPAAIAQRLGLSPSTVGNQIAAAYRDLGVSGRGELAALARAERPAANHGLRRRRLR